MASIKLGEKTQVAHLDIPRVSLKKPRQVGKRNKKGDGRWRKTGYYTNRPVIH